MEAAFEILTSERSYVDTLDQFVKNFLQPLKEGSKSHIITEQERGVLFSDIETIIALNKMFLVQVENRLRFYTNKTLIADIFLSFLPHFKMYTQYCYNYPNALATMTKLTEENSKFKSFIKKAESIMQKRFMDVLITPVQRVPRYVLLLDTLIKHTSEDHPDYAQLKKAHEQAQNAANDINQKLREAENRSRVLSVQQRFNETLDEDLVQPHRQHIREGVFRKKNEEDDMDWSDSLDDSETAQDEEEKGKMYCFLFNDIFLVAECVGKDKNKKFSLDGNFDLATTFVKDDAEADCLQVINPRCTYTFRCATRTEKELWRDTISQAIEHLLKINKSAVERRSSVELHFDEDTMEWSAEINNSPICCNRLDDNTQYRELVLENTQRELARFVEDNADKLAKIRVTPSKGKTPNAKSKSVFKRIQDTFITPQKSKDKLERERQLENQRLTDLMSGQSGSTRKRSATIVGVPSEDAFSRSSSMMDLAAQFAAAQTPIKSFETAEEVFAPGSPQVEFLSELTSKDNPHDGVSVLNKQLSFVSRQLSNLRTPAKTPGTEKKRRRREKKVDDSEETSESKDHKEKKAKKEAKEDGKENAKENKHKRSHTSTDSFDLELSDKKGGSVRDKKSSKRRQSMLVPKNQSISADILSQPTHSTPLMASAAISLGGLFGGVDSPSKVNSPSRLNSPARRATRMSLDPATVQRLNSPSKSAIFTDSPSTLRF
eukprot:TRINITY_DN9794_c0_g1_i1.p1 TRINITY_DN9794_c0_g1~~TRINITY_DN9794_c0_g1_i1.p1  ORF type:complete len:839 (-),score=226.46 TRINITY_DN9794_c0_g1_i1:118-2271(-)